MPDALKNINVNVGTLAAIAAGFAAVVATTTGVLYGLDARIDARLDARVTPLEQRLASMQETLRENEGRRNAQYGHIINTLDEIKERR